MTLEDSKRISLVISSEDSLDSYTAHSNKLNKNSIHYNTVATSTPVPNIIKEKKTGKYVHKNMASKDLSPEVLIFTV